MSRSAYSTITSFLPLHRMIPISVTVGAAVLPQHAAAQIKPVDVGLLRGRRMGPMERLIAYGSQPDSGVDVVRVGLEDTPYLLDPAGRVMPATTLPWSSGRGC